MAEQDLVTLEAPDGRRHRTDSASEINLLVGSYGYQRVEQNKSPSQTHSKRNSSKSSAQPGSSSAAAETEDPASQAPSS